jgi:photosystem II stability/assembly factor-like uncharacterized protein
LQTVDGGATWKEISAPSGRQMQFISKDDGWLLETDEDEVDHLYGTHSGGHDWKKVSLPIPSGWSKIRYNFPFFPNDKEGFLLVWYVKADAYMAALFTSKDGGKTWTLTKNSMGDLGNHKDELNHRHPSRNSFPALVAVEDPTHLKVVEIDSKGNIISKIGVRPISNQFLSEASVNSDSFVSNKEGWVMLGAGGCEQFKTDCYQVRQLLSTTDGGGTWKEIAVSRSKAP